MSFSGGRATVFITSSEYLFLSSLRPLPSFSGQGMGPKWLKAADISPFFRLWVFKKIWK